MTTFLQLGKIKAAFTKVLLKDGEMSLDLYKCEIEEKIGYLRRSQKKDLEDYIMCLTCNHHIPKNTYQVAMVLIQKNGKIFINEEAREELKKLWIDEEYKSNMKQLIPAFARDILDNYLVITGVTVVRPQTARRSPKGFGN